MITYGEYRNMMDRLEDTYNNHGHHPIRTYTSYVDPEGEIWRNEYFNLRNSNLSHEDAIRQIESRIDVLEGRPDRWANVNPDPSPTNPVGDLSIDGIHIIENGKIWKARGIVGFTAFKDWLDDRDHLFRYRDYILGKGTINSICFFLMWKNKDFSPVHYGSRFYDGYPKFLEWWKVQGIHPLPIYFCDQQDGSSIQLSRAEQDEHFRLVSQYHELSEYVNEDWQNGQIAHRFDPRPLASRSAFEDNNTFTQPGDLMAWTSQAFARKWDWMREGKNLLETCRLGLKNGEHTNKPAIAREPPAGVFEVNKSDWSRSADVQAFQEFHATCELMGSGSYIHGDDSNLQSCTPPGPNADRCVDGILEMWNAGIPPDADSFHYTRGGLSDCPTDYKDRYNDGGQEIDSSGALREFYQINGDWAYGMVIQPGRDWELRSDWTLRFQHGPFIVLSK